MPVDEVETDGDEHCDGLPLGQRDGTERPDLGSGDGGTHAATVPHGARAPRAASTAESTVTGVVGGVV